MLWVKAFHIIFVVTWFAGLFYLPRLFVYHAEMQAAGNDVAGHERFLVMERRLMGITNIGGALALVEPACNTVAFYFHELVWKRVDARRVLADAAARTGAFAATH